MADFYELLGVSRKASGRHQEGVRRKARELHPDTNAGDDGDGGAVQGSRTRLRDAVRSRSACPLRPLRRSRRRGRRPAAEGRRLRAGGLGDLFDAFFAGRAVLGSAGADRPDPTRAGPRGRRRPHVRAGGVRGDRAGHAALPTAATECGGSGAGCRHPAGDVLRVHGSGQVQRVRQSLLGQMVTTCPCQRCGGPGQVIATPCPTCRARAG